MVLLVSVETDTLGQGSGATTAAETNALGSAASAAAVDDGKRTDSNHLAMEVALPIVICAIGVFLALPFTYKRRRNQSRVSPSDGQSEDGTLDPHQELHSTDHKKSELDRDNVLSHSSEISSPQTTHEKAELSEEATKKLELEGQSALSSPQQPGEIAEAEGRAGSKPLTVELEG
ncbi:hypothetical protein LTR37_013453 [Vermiconidia calcicola]|uniref:Uncharacterized protein n=1 Tax=Vermiconidia calcicola TaxID=1690605 RepID=A0ACC3MWG5_9PEZI|nr:hypothetical protein LTR37_013453 [Vermiconidia calcicola]